MIPHIKIYTDDLPPNVGGCANGPIIRIRHKYRDDSGILAHELVHVRQWYAGVLIGALLAALLYWQPFAMPWLASWQGAWPMALIAGVALHPLMTAIPAYRLWKEVRAYKEQARHYPDDRLFLFAGFISSNYGLDVTPLKVYEMLKA